MLTRVWTPSGNNSNRSTSVTFFCLHTMEGFTGPNGAADCAHYFQGPVGASSHICADNYHPGKVWECVARPDAAWTQCNYNSQAMAIEQAGFASWSRSYWLDHQRTLLETTAAWLAEESAHFGIALNTSNVRYHSELGQSGCGHSDPGAGYPRDVVIEWALGGTAPPSGRNGANVSVAVAHDPDGHPHYACIGADNGAVYYLPPGWSNWGRIAPDQSGAVSGAGISISSDWWVELTYTNGSGQPCKYRKKWMEGQWGWSAIGSIKAK